MARVLLTGAGGFVGRHVAALLAADPEIEVHALVLPGAPTIAQTAVHEHACDLADEPSLRALIAALKPARCIHLAWNAAAAGNLAGDANTDSLHATLSLARILGAAGCNHMLGIGTGFEYAEQTRPLRETDACAPLNLYAACKLAAATVLPLLAAGYGMKVAWARLFFLYGPGESSARLVPSVIQGLLRGQPVAVTPAEQWYDYLHVTDAARGIALLSAGMHEGIYNVASGTGMHLRTLIEALAGFMNRPDLIQWAGKTYRPSEPMFVQADTTKLCAATGFTQHVDLREGIRSTVEFWRANAVVPH
jgi:nucleoside-diphosphate-sugar epimerase